MTATVTLAAIAGAHGITGEVRLKLFGQGLDSLEAHKVFSAGGRTLTLKSLRPDKIGAVARFAEISDRTAAEGLRGTLLAVPRASLPPLAEGEYYHADIIGLAVVDTDGVAVGTVTAIENYNAGDILEITLPDGKTAMVPFRPPGVPDVGDVVVVDRDWLV
ncbi:ribosome maturation factor RimM [Polymorphobacter fuscus]|uniref:Ribosome maturation factor RimM n=1 Tax=Sandarakinorhabdus fusca TaxID=1439888 RepID=A0A7C9GN13_9SPHN|nr:ribosome maturation factor RimM [Polymorphobacter fuscus]KAB7648468.1 16S rRNA processing protein RimM [Polymorphobacter fuscus]MQT15993.1 16S rRNA processing protein RimM [Polymorphobacter fuscus]NJC07730.1 16S rRNA processing protein RimM [Polymorphobacter fuscus]